MRSAVVLLGAPAAGLAFMSWGVASAMAGVHPVEAPAAWEDRLDPLELPPGIAAPAFPVAREKTIIPLPEDRFGDGRRRGRALAALGPAPDTALDGGGHAWAGPGALPAVPKPLAALPPGVEPAEGRMRAPDLPRLRLEGPWWAARAGQPRARSRCDADRRMTSAHSHRPASPWQKDKVASRPGDPLATYWPDEEGTEAAETANPPPAFIMPFANGRVTSLFNQGRRHPAIDLAGALGSPVLATTPGQKVVFAGRRGGYGNAVITRDGLGRTHLYGHLRSITSRVGQLLDQGDKLGHLGSTGHSTGPHVHYEVRDAEGRHINPVTLLFPGRRVAKGYAWFDVWQEPRSEPVAVAANASRQPRQR